MAKLNISKIHKKFQNQKFQNLKKTFLGNVIRYPIMKFQDVSSNGVAVTAGDRRTTDDRQTDRQTTDDGRISIL
jgi:hypothetical protein